MRGCSTQELLGQDAGAASGGAGDAAAAGEAGERHGIKYSVSDKGVATITIARPKRKNALDVETYRSIEGALKEAAASKAVRVVVLTGQGDYYSSGNDLGNFVGNMPPEGPEKLAADAAVLLEGFVNAFIEFPKPLVAAVNGPSIGIASKTPCLAAQHIRRFDFSNAAMMPPLVPGILNLMQCAA